MDAQDKFISIAALICEPARARMLWYLLDGRAYTAGELAIVTNASATSVSNHLSKLLDAKIVKVEVQGRHRYYAIAGSDIAYAIEGLANLATDNLHSNEKKKTETKGLKYCRTCYDHLAGFVGVSIAEALESKGYLARSKSEYMVSDTGWNWFSVFNISKEDFTNKRRPLTRQCLDWSERRPHLAGQLGSALLNSMLDRKWFRKVQFSRELVATPKGRKELYDIAGISLG